MGRGASGSWSIRTVVIVALGWLSAISASAADDWEPVRVVRGVQVDARPMPGSPFAEHRGTVAVCAQLDTLEGYVADTSQFQEWVPDTEEVRVLEHSENSQTYYLRTHTPWPLRSRDMIYRLTREPAADSDEVRIDVTGLPDYLPEQPGAVRMRSASGEWILRKATNVVVSFRLHVDPGWVPAVFANRRLAGSVGETLANLAERFSCSGSDS